MANSIGTLFGVTAIARSSVIIFQSLNQKAVASRAHAARGSSAYTQFTVAFTVYYSVVYTGKYTGVNCMSNMPFQV